MNDNALKALRARIDAVDMELLELLRKRADIIEEVRGVKGPQVVYIRPGREADMLRALMRQPMGHLPEGLAHRLWREMIGAFTLQEGILQEGAMRVAVCVPPGQDGYWDMARDHFGAFTPLRSFADARSALRAVIRRDDPLAALPFPSAQDDAWWQDFLDRAAEGVNVFYAFPFDGQRGNARPSPARAMAVGLVAPEETGDDRTLLAVRWRSDGTEEACRAALQEWGNRITACHTVSSYSWVELKGFSGGQGEAVKHWAEKHKAHLLQCRIVGGYPVPVA